MNAIRGNLAVNNPEPALLSINTTRTLSIDAVQAANSGHPGPPRPWRWRRSPQAGAASTDRCGCERHVHRLQVERVLR